MKNINSTIVLLCNSRKLEYYFSKGFVILERNPNNKSIISNEAKQIIHTMDMNDSDYVMLCTTVIFFRIKHPLKGFFTQSYLHSSYIQTIYNNK